MTRNRTLDQLLKSLDDGLEALRKKELDYGMSKSFKKFLSDKEADYAEFISIVALYNRNEFLPNVVLDMKSRKIANKYIGMTQRGGEYFKITNKLLNQIEQGY